MNKFKAVSDMLKLVKKTGDFEWSITHPVSGKVSKIYNRADEGLICYASWVCSDPYETNCDHNTFMGAIGHLSSWFIGQMRSATRESIVGLVFTVGDKSYKVVELNDLETCIVCAFSPFGIGAGKSFNQNIDSLIKAFGLGTAVIDYENSSF